MHLITFWHANNTRDHVMNSLFPVLPAYSKPMPRLATRQSLMSKPLPHLPPPAAASNSHSSGCSRVHKAPLYSLLIPG